MTHQLYKVSPEKMEEISKSNEKSGRLCGHQEIKDFIDPQMSMDYYNKKVKKHLMPILIKRGYARNNNYKYFTYKNILQTILLKMRRL